MRSEIAVFFSRCESDSRFEVVGTRFPFVSVCTPINPYRQRVENLSLASIRSAAASSASTPAFQCLGRQRQVLAALSTSTLATAPHVPPRSAAHVPNRHAEVAYGDSMVERASITRRGHQPASTSNGGGRGRCVHDTAIWGCLPARRLPPLTERELE